MRANTYLSPYNRRIARFERTTSLGHSQLANLAMGESKLIISLLDWSGGVDTVYHSPEVLQEMKDVLNGNE